jgi:putative ABC transport system permease protein
MSLLRAASLRHLWRHPAQLALALVGLALGVGTIVAVDIAIASARRAFELSLEAVNGAATHRIVSGPPGIDERLYVRLRTEPLPCGTERPQLAPVVAGYVTVGDRIMQLVGLDPFASAALGGATRDAAPVAMRDVTEVRDWLTQSGTVAMSAAGARELGIGADGHFELNAGGVRHPARLLERIAAAGSGFD